MLERPVAMIMTSARMVLPCRSIVTMSSAFESSRQVKTVRTSGSASGPSEPGTGWSGGCAASPRLAFIGGVILLKPAQSAGRLIEDGAESRKFQSGCLAGVRLTIGEGGPWPQILRAERK